MTWDPDELQAIGGAQELEIATTRADGSQRDWTPIWAVAVGGEVFVRTWHRRTTGWYGDAVARPTARIRVLGLETAVTVRDVGSSDAELRSRVDAAYATKYGPGQMADNGTAASTLRLDREESVDAHR